MSRPRFIRLPKEVIKKEFGLDIYQNAYLYPLRVETIRLDYDEWLKIVGRIDMISSKEIFKAYMTANNIKHYIMDKILEEKYNAKPTFESGGAKAGYTMNLYIDQDKFDKVYFYTMNLHKSRHARKDFDDQKFALINIYCIPYDIFKMLMKQDKYEFLFWQKPSGFVYNIDLAAARFHDWSFPLKNRKNINW